VNSENICAAQDSNCVIRVSSGEVCVVLGDKLGIISRVIIG
jgi:hypothetical protein